MTRALVLIVLLGSTGLAIWNVFRPGAASLGERMTRIGGSLVVVGLAWTVFAWWLVIPEVLLAIGVALLVGGLLSTRRAQSAH